MNSQLTQFTIFDSKAEAYLQPFFSLNRETAVREFTNAISKDGNFGKFAEDYAMFELGTFDQATGKSEMHDTPLHVVNAVTLKGRPSAVAEPGHLQALRRVANGQMSMDSYADQYGDENGFVPEEGK